MKVRALAAAGVGAFLGIAGSATLQAQEPLSVERVMAHVGVLAHDSLQGRATPSRGLDAAVAYTAEEFRRAGLRPLGAAGFTVTWPLVSRRRTAEGIRLTAGRDGGGELTYGREFAVMAAGVPEVSGRLVRVADLRDTAALRGRIPLLRLPPGDWQGPAHTAGRLARRAGAAAVILVLDSSQALAPVAEGGLRMDHAATAVPTILLTPAAARRLEGAADVTLRIPEQVDTTLAPSVLGLLPGRDAGVAREYVVVTAHLDHLGIGPPDERGDSIYNGADDNASGAAALIEMAHALGRLPAGTRRSVVFFGTTGEERCLCGSEYFTRRPPISLDDIVANVNLDGIGRSWQQDTLSAVGSTYSSLGRTVREVAARHPELRLTVVDDQWPERHYFMTSDQIWFARRGVPSLFLSSTGPDAHYHRPSDEAGTLEPDLTARIARLATWTVRAVADAHHR
ncbi:MAG TPA: M28 family peptidase, partial [Gemmatimonadales bacterium]